MPAAKKPRLALHFASGPEINSALCSRQTFQSARSALRDEVVHPTPTVTTDPEEVTCRRCLRKLGTLPPVEQDNEDEEGFES